MADPVSLAITVALNAATMAMTMMNKTEGPRLDDLTVSTADYGTPLVQVYGTQRVECPCFYAEPIREVKKKSKGKTGKYAEYKYYGTWGSILADCMNPAGALTDVLKIWLDRRLAYDKTGKGPVTLGISFGDGELQVGGLKMNKNCRVYLGTETQEQDPRMLAKIEAREGPGRCPAYLGLAYLMFEEFPLEKFGNRLPQISALVMRGDPNPAYPFESHDSALRFGTSLFWGSNFIFTPDFRKLVIVGGTTIEIWDIVNRNLTYSGHTTVGASNGIGVTESGSFYSVVGFPSASLFLVSPFGGAELITSRVNMFAEACEYVNGQVYVYPYGFILTYYGILTTDDLGYVVEPVSTIHIPSFITADVNGDLLVFGFFGSTNIIAINDVEVPSPTANECAGFDTGHGTYCVGQGSNLYLIDKESMTITHTVVAAFTGNSSIYGIMKNQKAGQAFIWIETKQYDLQDLSLMQSISPGNWSGEPMAAYRYDPINDALIGEASLVGHLNWLFLNRGGPNGYLLGDICADVALQCGFDEDEFDFTNLDQEVEGYCFTQGPGKQVIGALLEIHDSDIRPHEFIQQGLKRGQALNGESISSEWMVPESNRGDEGSNPLYSIPIASETDLPRRVWATFADPGMDYQANTAIVQRNSSSVRTDRETSFDLGTMAAEPDNIQPMLERSLRRYWIGATKPECRLSPLELRLEPGDVRQLIFDSEKKMRCRCTRTRIRANRVIDTEWEVDGETQLNPPDWQLDDANPLNQLFNSPGGQTNGRDPDTILYPQETKGFIIDTPLFTDADDQAAPFLYVAAGPEFPNSFWPGGGIYVSDSGVDIDSYIAGFDGFTSDDEVVWGVSVGALPSATPSVIDYGTELEVYLPAGGELESSTEDLVLANAAINLAIVGDEIIQFINADEIATDRWVLTGLVRGHRGTEYAIDTHLSGERFILIGSTIKKHDMGASEIGDTDYYKFSTLGDNLSAVETIALTYRANANRPLSPAHVELQQQVSGDWQISWIRRTRIGGSAVNGQDVPLGETSELYRVKIMDGTDEVQSYDVTDPEFTYTVAEQNADWGSAQTSLSVQVCQISPLLSLEGFASAASA
jgi:hypothetical protein